MSTLALAISTAMVGNLQAQEATTDEVVLDTLFVEESTLRANADPYAEPGAPYKAKSLSDSRRSWDIAKRRKPSRC
ncbi:MAG: hypothetical protein R3F53_03900 [Gammaproteobacteria bacterium]